MPAQEEVAGSSTPPFAETSVGAVAKELAKLDYFNAEPNWNAEYFIYLQSASWCPPCRAEMPKIVEQYEEMRKNGVEIILLGCDRNRPQAEAYLKQFNAKFPGVMIDKAATLPGYTESQYIPNAAFVDKNGNVLQSGHGSIIMQWRSIISQKTPQDAQS